MYRSNNPPTTRITISTPTTFKGNEPPKMPEFLKPYHEHALEEQKKQPGKLKTTLLTVAGSGGIIAIAALSQVVLPVAIAGVATFALGFPLVMFILNKAVPPSESHLKPMTREQLMADSQYTEELNKYNRKQKIAKVKKFFGLKVDS